MSRVARWLALGISLAGALWSTTSHADPLYSMMIEPVGYANQGYGEPLIPSKAGLVLNSVGYESIRQATTTNAQIYGAIGAFDRYIRPLFDKIRKQEVKQGRHRDSDTFVFALDHHQTYNVGHAIGLCGPGGLCDGRARAYSADLYSSSISAAWGNPERGFFLSASHSLTILPGPSGDTSLAFQRGLFASYMFLTTIGGMPIYRLLGKGVFNAMMPGSADGIIGGYATVGPVKAYGGYVLSSGLFGDVSAPELSTFLSAVLADSFSSVPLIKGGLRGLELAKEMGLTSLYAQRFDLPAPTGQGSLVPAPTPNQPPSDPSIISDQALKDRAVHVVTTHLQQMNIADYVDARLAAGLYPNAFFHEAVVSLHSENFTASSTVLDSSEDYREHNLEWALTLGAMKLPALTYSGVKGGVRPLFKAQIRYKFLSAFVRMNDTEFLQSFPFAYNAVNGGIAFSFKEGGY